MSKNVPKKNIHRCFSTLLLIGSIFAALSFASCRRQEPSVTTIFSASHVSPGRAIPGLEAFLINYYEPVLGEGFAGAWNIQESDEPFMVVAFGPTGVLPSEIRRPSIYVVFSQPVVPLARLGEVQREDAAFFTIEPPLTGVYRWYGTRLLAFEPDAENLPQQEFRVTVSDRIRSLGGRSLEGERSFTFETERLSLLNWNLGTGETWVNHWDADLFEAQNIRLIFSSPVNLAEISNWIEVSAAGRTFPFTLSRLPRIDERRYQVEQGVMLTLNDTLPPNVEVRLRIRAGARSEAGWLGTRENADFGFHTVRPFRFNNVWASSIASPRTREGDDIPISLNFSHPVDPEISPYYFSVQGMPPLTRDNIRVFGSTVVLSGLPLEYETNYQIRISGNLRDIHGRSLEHEVDTLAAVGQASSYVFFLDSGPRMLEAQFPPKVIWETLNPVSIRSLITSATGPYQRIPLADLVTQDISNLERNTKHFFIEDLSPFMGPTGRGSAAMAWEFETRSQWHPGMVFRNNTWLTVQVTDIGITMRHAYNRVLVWATRLSTGEPIPGARVELREGTAVVREGTTDARGLAVFNFAPGEFASLFTDLFPGFHMTAWDRGFRVRVVEGGGAMAGGDEAEFIPNGSHNLWRFRVEAAETPFVMESERPLIFLFTDRGIYRPGETVTFRGIDRTLSRGNFTPFTGSYRIEVSTGVRNAPIIASLSGTATANGGSFGYFTLPENLDPGRYVIRYIRGDGSAEMTIIFVVANFERLRFETSIRFAEPLFYQGERISARLSASYLAGGAMSGAPFTYYWSREPAGFNPGGAWQHWRFGPDTFDSRFFAASGEGVLGPDGTAEISHMIDVDGIEGITYRYLLQASVQDAARQEIATRATVVVHPASFYIGSRLDEGSRQTPALDVATPAAFFLTAGSPATMSWALLTPEGEFYQSAEAPEITFTLVRHEWRQTRQAGVGGRINLIWERVEETVLERRILPGRGEYAGVVSFTPAESGQWEARLSSRDSMGRPAQTRHQFFVSGAGWVHWGRWDADTITLTPDRASYAPGETARLLVQSPLPRGRYLLTLEREGIIEERVIELDGSARTIEIPINESHIPIVYVAISSYTVRTGPPEHSFFEPDQDRPRGLFGLVALYVDHESKSYAIDIIPSRGAFSPGEEAEVTLRVTHNGRPAPGVEVSFLAVDRGVLDLINYRVPDPMAFFYNPSNFPLGVRGADSRSLLIDPVTYTLADLHGGDGMDGFKLDDHDDSLPLTLDERGDFRPTAVFEPFLVTGPDGTVTVRFTLPDTLTTYRATAVAVGLNTFGIAEYELRVSAPLTALPALPRRLRWRDTGTVSLILTNLEREAVEAVVSVETETLDDGGLWDTVLEIDGIRERTVRIEAGASMEVPFRVAALGAGESRVIFTLRSPLVNERIIRTLNVDRPVVFETVTAIGSLGDDNPFIEEGVILPSVVPVGTGSLSVSLSNSRLALLKEAVRFLLDYPFGGLEQRTARLLPIVAFADRLEIFGLESPVENPARVIEEELAFLARNQLQDGSFPFWPGGRIGNAYVTLRVAHITALARQRGFAIPPEMDIQAMLRHITSQDFSRRRFGPGPQISYDHFLRGYSLWVRAMLGERIGAEITAYLRGGDELGISGWGFGGLAALELDMVDLASSARDRIRRFMRPGARTVYLTDTYERHGNFWGSDTDRYAIALMLYHALSPADDMTTRLVNSLIERQRRGVWGNTSSSHWAVLAFARIADAEEREWAGNLDASLSLGGVPLLNVGFHAPGGVPEQRIWTLGDVPLTEIDRDILLPLRIERQGFGRLYYTVSLRYGIPAELAAPRDEGISVFAEVFDSAGNQVTDGVLIPGRTYTRRVTVSTSRDRTFLALRAPIPSGAEIVDATFVTSPTPPPREQDFRRWDEFHFRDRQPPPIRFIMDNEVVFHWDLFPAGRQQVEFRFRAVMPGIYPTPPVQAESMFEEEVFGRGAGELFRIGL